MAAVSSPTARMTSGRSSSLRRCSSVARFFRYGSSRISSSERPCLCSRTTYEARASSFEIPRDVSDPESSPLPNSFEKKPTPRLYPWRAVEPEGMRFATRTLHGVGDDGGREEILIWIERRPGAVLAVGRAIDIDNRQTPRPRADDYVFEGYEMGDA